MKLLIHDLNDEEWEKVSADHSGWKIISDNGKIHPCTGCFGCWIKTPGKCVIKDGFDNMGALISKADEVMVISRYTYGGFSSFIKNVFDRSIGWVLPYFEIINGEMHHKSRYPEDKPFTFIFRGSGLTDDDKAQTEKYIKAVCLNLHGIIKDIRFEECAPAENNSAAYKCEQGSTVLLNCSLRGKNANTKMILDRFESYIDGTKQSIDLVSYLNKQDELVDILANAEKLVLGMPLYVDGIPSAVLRLMEKLETRGRCADKRVYVIANMGFYESRQISNLMGMMKKWCDNCGYVYGGGLAVGAGEMLGKMVISASFEKGPAKNVAIGMQKLSKAVNSSGTEKDIYADVSGFPRKLYMMSANMSWLAYLRKNGLKKKDLLRRCDQE